MSRIRDHRGRYVNTGKLIEIPTNYCRGRKSPTTNSPEKYRKMPIGSSSTLKPQENPLEDLTGEAIEGEGTLAKFPKDPIPKEVQEGQPLETPIPPLVSNPINTTFSLVGDSNFVDFVDPASKRSLWNLSRSSYFTN